MVTEAQLRTMSKDAFESLRASVNSEYQRRQTVEIAPLKVEEISKRVYLANGGDGRDYVQPTGAHDAYPMGSIVRQNNKYYVSLIAANVWPPDQFPRGWAQCDQNGNPVEPVVPAAWVKPVGAHDSYRQNEVVVFEGKIYSSNILGNVWSPSEQPNLWTYVGDVVPTTGDPLPEPTIPAFVQPTGAGDAYKIGDKVVFEEKIYESLIDNNVWSPSGYPAGWKAING